MKKICILNKRCTILLALFEIGVYDKILVLLEKFVTINKYDEKYTKLFLKFMQL